MWRTEEDSFEELVCSLYPVGPRKLSLGQQVRWRSLLPIEPSLWPCLLLVILGIEAPNWEQFAHYAYFLQLRYIPGPLCVLVCFKINVHSKTLL